MDERRRNREAARLRGLFRDTAPPGAGINAAKEMDALAQAFSTGRAGQEPEPLIRRYRTILIWCCAGLLLIAASSIAAYFALRPAEAQNAYDAGQRLSTAGRYREAIVYFDRATGLDPKFVDAYYARALAFAALGQESEELLDLNRVLKAHPDSADALFRRATIYERRGDSQKAIQDLDRVIALRPEDGPSYAARGAACKSLRNYHRAIADYTRAIQYQPTVNSYLERASAYQAVGENRKALDDMDRAIELKPTTYFLYRMRANIRMALGDASGSASDRQTAKELAALR